ncbi:hypothetical protein ACFSLT_03885 [Novosphingobium resinovorum]
MKIHLVSGLQSLRPVDQFAKNFAFREHLLAGRTEPADPARPHHRDTCRISQSRHDRGPLVLPRFAVVPVIRVFLDGGREAQPQGAVQGFSDEAEAEEENREAFLTADAQHSHAAAMERAVLCAPSCRAANHSQVAASPDLSIVKYVGFP